MAAGTGCVLNVEEVTGRRGICTLEAAHSAA